MCKSWFFSGWAFKSWFLGSRDITSLNMNITIMDVKWQVIYLVKFLIKTLCVIDTEPNGRCCCQEVEEKVWETGEGESRARIYSCHCAGHILNLYTIKLMIKDFLTTFVFCSRIPLRKLLIISHSLRFSYLWNIVYYNLFILHDKRGD